MRTNHLTQRPRDLPCDPSPGRGPSPPGACFAWGIVLALFVLAELAITTHAAKAGSITYAIQNYPADQDGHTVSGSITTDGKTGLLDTSDITSWAVTIDTTTFRSTDPGSNTQALGVFATTTGIKIAGFGGGLLLGTHVGFNYDVLVWDRVPLDSNLSLYGGTVNSVDLWSTFNPAMGGTNPWVLASVPEPSSFTLAVLGVGALIVAGGWSRLRKARPTA